MREFKDYLKIILRHEGLYSDHKADKGGPTNRGISLRFLTMQGIDINNDGEINVKDIKELTLEQATELYYKHFWKPMRLEGIDNELLKLHLFDMGVNAGTKTAVKILQDMLGVTADGVIGPKTLQSINEYGVNIVADYINARKSYYIKIIKKNPNLRTFQHGWFRRVDSTYFK